MVILRRAGDPVPAVPGLEPARRARVQVLLAALPFLSMAVVASVDIIAGPGIGFLPMLSLGPALAPVFFRPVRTSLTGGLAIALCLLLAMYDSVDGQRREYIALATIVGVTAAGAVASLARHRREQELASVRAVAEAAQQVLLRPVPEQAGPVRLAVRYISAAASARIGGDLYGVAVVGGTVRLIVGDVQGKGLAAVQTAATVLGAFREAAHEAPDLTAIADRIETSLAREAGDEEFATAVLAQIPSAGTVIQLLNCGHPAPLLLRHGEEVSFAEPPSPGLPLGLASLATAAREVQTVPLGPDDQILLYTDGISEARDNSGRFYQLERCGDLLGGEEAGSALDRLSQDVTRHVGHALLDDAAMLLITAGHGNGVSGTARSGGRPAGSRPPGRARLEVSSREVVQPAAPAVDPS